MAKRITGLILHIVPVALILVLSGFGDTKEKSFPDKLHDKLDRFNRDFYTEKAFLVTDRFAYRPGEDIWFQGFVSSQVGLNNDSSSKDMFVKFVNMKGEEIISRRYPLIDNQATGRFLIPRTSIPGKYYLLAYTGWMKNQNPRDVFKKEILVGKYYDKRFQVDILYNKSFYYAGDSMHANIRLIDPAGKPIQETEFTYTLGSFSKDLLKGYGKTSQQGIFGIKCQVPSSEDILTLRIELKSRKISGDYTLILPAAASDPEIRFHSEDGNVVAGLSNLMAFHSHTHYGIPVSITGEIIDRNHRVLQTVESNNKGIGSFTYTPSGDSAFLRILKPEGITRLFPLPKASAGGVILHLIRADKDTAWCTLLSTEGITDSVFYWVALLNRHIVWDSVTYGTSNEVKIPLKNIGTGIMQVSVFNQDEKLLGERLLQVSGEDMLNAKTDRQLYQSRQRVVLTIDYLGKSNKVDMAMTVSLRQLAFSPLNTGFEQTLYSFPYDTLSKDPGILSHLSDIELMISEYREISWNELLKNNPNEHAYTKLDGLTGTVIDKKENPAQHAKVRVTHLPNFRFYETQSNENGYFQVLFGSDVIDFNYLKIDAYDALGKVNLIASVNQLFSNKLKEIIVQSTGNHDKQKIYNTAFYGDPDVIYSLRYGSRKYFKSENESRRRYDPKLYSDYADALDIIQELKPFQLKNNMIVFADSGGNMLSSHMQEGVIIVINGAIKGTSVDILKGILPSDITNINISESLMDVHRYTPVNFQGVIELTTIQSMYKYRQPGMQMGMDILNTSREFYSPDYAIETAVNTDNRKTLYWNPHLTITQGLPALITFYTSDVKGIYYGKIEGMDAEGHPVQDEFTIVVE
jgi:alpha-2-macroglobulin-like protein